MNRIFFALMTLFGLLLLAPTASGQIDQFGLGGFGNTEPVSATGWFTVDENGLTGVLHVKASIEPGWHLYSMTMNEGFRIPAKINPVDLAGAELTGPFVPDSDPIRKVEDSEEVEEHEFSVTWTAPIRFPQGRDPKVLTLALKLTGQSCESKPNGTCVQVREDITAAFRESVVRPRLDIPFRGNETHAVWSGKAIPSTIAPGDSFDIEIVGEPVDGYHLYSTVAVSEFDSPTVVYLHGVNGWEVGPLKITGELHDDPNGGLAYYSEPVTFRFTVTVPGDTSQGEFKVNGRAGFQTCNDSGCDFPRVIDFSFDLKVASTTGNAPAMAIFDNSDMSYNDARKQAESIQTSGKKDAGEWASLSLPIVFLLAFAAGFILNFMPCVLPVIGLKIMSFVHQAGKNPGRVILLNTVFSLGIVSVFLLLATLAVFFGYGWGDLYKNTAFTVVMVSVVFVFGLSFFGVWEIPLPGFVGSASAEEKEGLSGTFFKGVLTTLLATPCSGPLIIPAVVWAIAQPWWLTYLAFLAMGMGMAIPYLVIGFFPGLVKALPRPGAWMETFKELMGFVLMGTCVFFVSGINQKYQISGLSMLVFLGLACWIIGRTSVVAELHQRLWAWGKGLAVTALGFLFSFYVLLPTHELPWQDYSKFQFEKLLAEGTPVFVDFTADW